MHFASCPLNSDSYPLDSLKIAFKRSGAKSTESSGVRANLQPRLAIPFTLFVGAHAGAIHGPFHGGI
jgi:hypothetical protein